MAAGRMIAGTVFYSTHSTSLSLRFLTRVSLVVAAATRRVTHRLTSVTHCSLEIKTIVVLFFLVIRKPSVTITFRIQTPLRKTTPTARRFQSAYKAIG